MKLPLKIQSTAPKKNLLLAISEDDTLIMPIEASAIAIKITSHKRQENDIGDFQEGIFRVTMTALPLISQSALAIHLRLSDYPWSAGILQDPVQSKSNFEL